MTYLRNVQSHRNLCKLKKYNIMILKQIEKNQMLENQKNQFMSKELLMERIENLNMKVLRSETQNEKLAEENLKLQTQNKNQTILLNNKCEAQKHELILKHELIVKHSKSQEEVGNLKKTVDDQKSKLNLRQQKIETLEKNMNTLMDKFIPNDGTEKTFLKLREEMEYLKRTHGTQKEQIEILQTQLANCQCLHNEH